MKDWGHGEGAELNKVKQHSGELLSVIAADDDTDFFSEYL